MPGVAVIGSQWGDEGKGKVVDYYCEKADSVVRFNGGNNAGHTVVVGDKEYKFHVLPSGVCRNKRILIGTGIVIDPKVLLKEIDNLGFKPDLGIDPRAHIIMPYHHLQEEGSEKALGKKKIGTTNRGIGPCYADRAARQGIRFEELVDKGMLAKRVSQVYPQKKALLEKVYGLKVPFSEQELVEEYHALGERLAPFITDVSIEVNNSLDNGREVLFEGAQGTFLDNDFGTYPFVTSSHPISAGVGIGVGMPVSRIEKITGIVKAYTTRVGEGPFVTELFGEQADQIREKGAEYGTTTGRPRRVGWLDFVQLRTSVRINGFTDLGITKLDVLSGQKKILVAESYECDGESLSSMPSLLDSVEKCKPNYIEFDGFVLEKEEIKKAVKEGYKGLPRQAREYLEAIEKTLNTRISLVSIGPERNETVLKG